MNGRTSLDDDDLSLTNEAGEKLIDRLVDLLGECISERNTRRNSGNEKSKTSSPQDDDDQDDQDHHQDGEQEQQKRSARQPKQDPRKGISLPAAAIDWLVRQLDDNDGNDEDDDKKSLLMALLHHVQSLRVTLEPWPTTTTTAVGRSNSISRMASSTYTKNADMTTIDPNIIQRRFVSKMKRRPDIDLRIFPKLQILWLDQIPIEWINNIVAIAETLQVLRITQSCIYNLRMSPLLLPSRRRRSDDDEVGGDDGNHNHSHDNGHGILYPSLTHLKLSWCDLNDGSGLMKQKRSSSQSQQRSQPSLARMSNQLRSIDLSHNDLSNIMSALAGLRYQRQLQKLDLSYNRLSSVSTIHVRLLYSHTNVRILNISYNQLVNVQGIERLASLVTLRLSHNRLYNLQDTANRLAGLVQLRQLSLEGNPLQFIDSGVTIIDPNKKKKISDMYRLDIFNAFRERRFGLLGPADFANMTLRSVQALLPILDGHPASLPELRNLRNRTFIPVRIIPLAVQIAVAAAQQQQKSSSLSSRRRRRRVVAPIVDGDIVTGWRPRRQRTELAASTSPGKATKRTDLAFSSHDVVEYLTTNPTTYNRKATMADRSDHSKIPENVMIIETSPIDQSEREEWEKAFTDNVAIRYLTHARPQTTTSLAKETRDIQSCDHAQAFLNTSSTKSLNKQPAAESEATLTIDAKQSFSQDDVADLSLSILKDTDEDDMKASGTTTVTTAASTQPEPPPLSSTPERTFGPSSLKNGMDHSASSATPQGTRLSLQVAPFSEHQWQDDNLSLPSSLGTPYKSDGGLTKWEILRLAEENSKFEGPYTYQKLLVHSQLELYFEQFVFAEPKKVLSEIWYDTICQYPKLGLWPVDRKRRDEALQSSQHFSLSGDDREVLRRVWKETIVPCGKHALRRLTPNRSERYGFHGELLWTSNNAESMRPDVAIDARQAICCNSDKCFYIIVDHDSATSTRKKNGDVKPFPRPVPKKAVFLNAFWPHALACHSFDTLERITIGFSFQRLTLQFRHAPSNEVFIYVLLTASKSATVELLKEFQELASNAKGSGFGILSAQSFELHNDDPVVLDAIGKAIAPDALGVVLHYQIVRQRWKHGDRGLVRRVCILTDSNIYLLDEDYGGDGSSNNLAHTLGHSSNRLVDGAALNQIVEVQAARDDPTAITIVLRLASLSKPHNWRLVCRTKEGAEKLVDDVRKATRGPKR